MKDIKEKSPDAIEASDDKIINCETDMSTEVQIAEEPFVSGMTRRKKKKARTIEQKRAVAGYIFILPFIIGFVFLLFPPILTSLAFAFSKVQTTAQGAAGFQLSFAGLTYFKGIFNDIEYIKAFWQSLASLGTQVLAIIIFSFVMANILNQKFKGRLIARAVFFLPVLTTSAAIVLLNQFDPMYNTQAKEAASGSDSIQFLDQILVLVESFKLPAGSVRFLTDLVANVQNMISQSGVQILVFLSGLQTISPSLFESSKIEGATPWEDFWKITFPMISPLILVNTVYTVIDSMSGLENSLMSYIYRTKIMGNQYSLGSAMSWFYFVIVFALTALVSFVISKVVYYEND